MTMSHRESVKEIGRDLDFIYQQLLERQIPDSCDPDIVDRLIQRIGIAVDGLQHYLNKE